MVRAKAKLPTNMIACPICKRRKLFSRPMDLNQHLKKVHDYAYKVEPPKKLDEGFSWIPRRKLDLAIQI